MKKAATLGVSLLALVAVTVGNGIQDVGVWHPVAVAR